MNDNKVKEEKKEKSGTKKRGWWSRFLERLAESNRKYPASGCPG